MRHIRIFISSPSDVEFERARVDRVCQRLNGELGDIARLEPIRWETRFYSAHESFQPQIPQSVDCDLVIGIFWSRLGTPLPPTFPPMPDGEAYPSGTAYELLTATQARRDGDKPDVFVFRKTAPPVFRIDRRDELVEAQAQWERLEVFFERHFGTASREFIAAFHRFETTDGFENQVEALLRGWLDKNVRKQRALRWPPEKGSPFRGLEPFDAEHASVFFGRDRKIGRALSELVNAAQRENGLPFLLIVGASGAGKSSLMRAGIAPRLTCPGMIPTVDLWRTAILRVGDDTDPFLGLAKVLLGSKTLSASEEAVEPALPELRKTGYRQPDILAGLLRGAGQAQAKASAAPILETLDRLGEKERQMSGFDRPLRCDLLVLLDQFENMFAASLADEERNAFALLLNALCATRRIWIIATIRADLYGRLIAPGGFIALKDAGGHYDLAPPGEAELTEIVHKSAEAAGLVYEFDERRGERLDERILRDAAGENMLPLLQYALDRLYGERRIDDGEPTLLVSAYEAMGGLDGAIDQTAERILAERVGEDEIAVLPRLLRSLVASVDEEDVASGRLAFTARERPTSEVIPDGETRRLVDALIEARILVASGDLSSGKGSAIGVAHQRVFDSWKRARAIIAEHQDFYRIRRDVEQQYLRWEANRQEDSFLLPNGPALKSAQEIVHRYGNELSEAVLGFVASSTRYARRKIQRLRLTAALMFLIAVFATGAFSWAIVEKGEAERNFEVAQRNYDTARQTIDNVNRAIVTGLSKAEGIRVTALDNILTIIDEAIRNLTRANADDALVTHSRATMLFLFAQVYKAKNVPQAAVAHAIDSLALRSSLSRCDTTQAGLFETAPQDWRFELSESLDLVGDLARPASPKDTAFADLAAEQIRSRAPIPPCLTRLQAAGDKEPLAERLYRASLIVRRALVAEAPRDNRFAYGLSLSFVRLGDLALRENPRAARDLYRQALDNTSSMLRRELDKIDWQRELSWDLNKFGDASLRFDPPDIAAAHDAYSAGLCVRRHVAEENPANTLWQRDLAFSLDKMAQLDLRDAAGRAEAEYVEAFGIRRRLYDGDHDNTDYVRDLAASLDELGVYYQGRNKPEWAYAFYDWELELRERLAPSNAASLEKLRAVTAALKAKLGDSSEAASMVQSIRQGTFETSVAARAPSDPAAGCWANLVKEVSRNDTGEASPSLVAKVEP
jgi:hypothetical protein